MWFLWVQESIKAKCEMNILHIITGLNDGGAEAVLYRLINACNEHHHSVVSLMGTGKYGPMMEKIGVPVICLNMPRGRVTITGLRTLWRVLTQKEYDIVQTWMYHADFLGGVLARLAGVHRIFWGIRHSTLEAEKSRYKTIAIARVNGWLSHWIPTAIVCCAERAREAHRALGYASEKLIVIPNGYDLSHFQPDNEARIRLRTEWGVTDGMMLLGMVGRFHPVKDYENLLRAIVQLKQAKKAFRFVLVGKGLDEKNKRLASWLKEYSLCDDILLLGQRNDVPDVMNALDVHVLSSASEAFPNVLAEAMACGTPCVTTDVGDASLIVGDIGWVVPPHDSQALASAIQDALEQFTNVEAWQDRKVAARKRIESKFSIETMVAAYNHLWNRCFSGLNDVTPRN
jgi:glycosyltransferase involved in cell wall biosynthesis